MARRRTKSTTAQSDDAWNGDRRGYIYFIELPTLLCVRRRVAHSVCCKFLGVLVYYCTGSRRGGAGQTSIIHHPCLSILVAADVAGVECVTCAFRVVAVAMHLDNCFGVVHPHYICLIPTHAWSVDAFHRIQRYS